MVSKGKQFKGNRPQERQKAPGDYEQKVLDVSRVARVTAGGRRFSFRVTVVIGDRAGKVGLGVKKGKDVQLAIAKADRNARKDMITVPVNDKGTIPYEVYGKFGSSVIFLKPARDGSGIKAGGAVRAVCDLAGYRNIGGKILSRSGNKMNIAKATLEALKSIKHVQKSEKKKAIKKDNKKDADTSTKTEK